MDSLKIYSNKDYHLFYDCIKTETLIGYQVAKWVGSGVTSSKLSFNDNLLCSSI